MTFPRYVAATYIERHCGDGLPRGWRVQVQDISRPPVPSNLELKPRGRRPVPLRDYVKGVRAAA